MNDVVANLNMRGDALREYSSAISRLVVVLTVRGCKDAQLTWVVQVAGVHLSRVHVGMSTLTGRKLCPPCVEDVRRGTDVAHASIEVHWPHCIVPI